MPDDRISVITWNLFHGQDGSRLGPTLGSILRRRTLDDGFAIHRNRKWVDEMGEVIRAQAPTFAALQEVSPQAVDRLARVTGMAPVRAIMRPLIGPLWLRGWLADRNPDLWRTHEGTANVVLAAPGWTPDPAGTWTLRHNPPFFAARHGHRLRIGLRERIHWILEPRRLVCGRFRRADGRTVSVVSIHCHNSLVWDVIGAEVARVLPQILERVDPAEPLVVAGDFNAAGRRHPAIAQMLDAGFDEATVDELVLDHVFSRNLTVLEPPRPLDTEVRSLTVPFGDATRSVLLSDHELVRAEFRLPAPSPASPPQPERT